MAKFLRGVGLGRFLYRNEVGLGYNSHTDAGYIFPDLSRREYTCTT
jgi:hypothetical protein